jgi:hypothetical protein
VSLLPAWAIATPRAGSNMPSLEGTTTWTCLLLPTDVTAGFPWFA